MDVMGRRSVWVWLLLAAICAVPAAAVSVRPEPAPESSSGARVVVEEQVGPRLVDLTVQSTALRTTSKVRLLTPDGWEQRKSNARWPVLYLLHGCCDDYGSWTRSTDVANHDELRDVLVVMPDGGPVGWYSDWRNVGGPAWETYHLTELRLLLENSYGAGEDRVIAGLSMGGLGALLYAAHNPGMFLAAASYSGVVHPLYDGFPRGLLWLLSEYDEDPLAMWGDPVEQRDLWEAHDPYYLAGRLRTIPVFLSSGNGRAGPFDQQGSKDDLEAVLHEMNKLTAAQLQQAGANLTTDFYGPGTHTWPYWVRELDRSLPLLLCALNDVEACA
jgi:diacylglycerol O-acyltransferase/trehalose O-mycolyltransferase